jgi:predicted HTH transcriptional regulator
MMTEELLDLIQELRRAGADTPRVEAKRAERELPRRLWQTLSAFANTRGGGVIVLGVDETAGFAAVGVRDPGKLMQDLATLCGEMVPPIRAAIRPYSVEDRVLVVAEVPETEIAQKPCYYQGAGLTNGAFIRVGDGDRRLSAYEVQLMLASRGQPRDDETPVPDAHSDDLDAELVAGLLGRLRQPETSYFRQLDALERHLARRAIVRGAFREEEWEYPETAVREALVNALVHRDLSSAARGTPVQIQLFPDRLTIVNPGGLFGPVTVDRLGKEGISSTRNQVLMKLLEDTATPKEGRLVCENRGSGIGAMLAALGRAGLPPPRFVDRVATFDVTFWTAQPEQAAQRPGRARRAGDRRQEILALLQQHGELGRSEIAAALGLSDPATRRWLRILRDERLIEVTTKSERSKLARYRSVTLDDMLLEHDK